MAHMQWKIYHLFFHKIFWNYENSIPVGRLRVSVFVTK